MFSMASKGEKHMATGESNSIPRKRRRSTVNDSGSSEESWVDGHAQEAAAPETAPVQELEQESVAQEAATASELTPAQDSEAPDVAIAQDSEVDTHLRVSAPPDAVSRILGLVASKSDQNVCYVIDLYD